MSDEENGEDVLDHIIADLERVEAFLERAEVTTEAANNRLRIYRDRYHDDDEDGGGNKAVYGGPD